MAPGDYVAVATVVVSVLTLAASVWVAQRSFVHQAKLSRESDERQRNRDREDERRSRIVQYLVDSYSAIEDASERPHRTPEQTARLERALANIQLLGNREQVEATRKFAAETRQQTNGAASSSSLLRLLRRSLRSELGLDDSEDDPIIIRYTSSNRDQRRRRS